MKKLDKLVLFSFIGPFVLTFFVTVFILLLVFMLKYFDDLVGKGIDFVVILELVFYFAINTVPNALPLAVLLSSLMTFGRLGEHFELIAIKSAGISLLRILRPVFFLVLLITGLSFINNNYIVPKANIKAYSLLYDIKKKKPSMDLQEGQFYNGLPGYSIKVNEKLPDGETLKDVIIYQHVDRGQTGNNVVIVSDSSKMYTMLDDRYMVLDLFNGSYYLEKPASAKKGKKRSFINIFYRNEFSSMKMVFNLASFDLGRTNEELFSGNRLMKNVSQLKTDSDSMDIDSKAAIYNAFHNHNKNTKYNKFKYQRLPKDIFEAKVYKTKKKNFNNKAEERFHIDYLDPIVRLSNEDTTYTIPDSVYQANNTIDCDVNDTIDFINPYVLFEKRMNKTLVKKEKVKLLYSRAVTHVRRLSNATKTTKRTYDGLRQEVRRHDFQRFRKYAESLSCIIMFLIGAPLGAIIKRGGLGLPVLISIIFFIIFYIFTMLGDKWSKIGVVDSFYASWMANIFLAPVGLFFLRQARIDARVFDTDVYLIMYDKVKKWVLGLRGKK